MPHHARLVVPASPCTACIIINHLNLETLQKTAAARPDFSWEVVEVSRPRDLRQIDGLEVEHLPAILIDEEQISAGNILSPKMLSRFLDRLSPRLAAGISA